MYIYIYIYIMYIHIYIARSRKHLYHPLHIDLFVCVVKKTENVLFKLLSIHQKPNGNSSTWALDLQLKTISGLMISVVKPLVDW